MATSKKKETTKSTALVKRPAAQPRVIEAPLSIDARHMLGAIEAMNPLRGLTATSAQNLFDASRAGDTTRLQWLYEELEAAIPAMLLCAERRGSAIAGYDWHIAARDHVRAGDEGLRDEQQAALKDAFADIDQLNFSDVIEHLGQAFFRGYSHASPRWAEDGLSVEGFELLKGWNIVRNAIEAPGVWHWNPRAEPTTAFHRLPAIPPHELISIVRPRHIDYPALQICLRVALGDKAWGKFVDRYGIPPVIIIMPPDVDNTRVQPFVNAAGKVADGGSGVLPHGSMVNYAEGGRGVDPFTAFVERQEKAIVLLGTGGILTSLVEATGIGSGSSGAHADTWREIVRRDIRFVGNALDRQLAVPILERAFPGRPQLAYFSFDQVPAPTADELFETAAKARQAGYLVVQTELEEKSGMKLEREMSAPPEMPQQASWQIQNSAAVPAKAANPAGKSRESASGATRKGTEGVDGAEPATALTGALADTISTDNRAITHLIENSESAADAQEAIKRYLSSRAPDKAALIQAAMAKAMATGESDT